jgi:hypothetical protein
VEVEVEVDVDVEVSIQRNRNVVLAGPWAGNSRRRAEMTAHDAERIAGVHPEG